MSPGRDVLECSAHSQLKTLKRACDCCRKRKVKCDGEEPCGPCRKATIRCAYLQPPKKKGPKGLRSARVLNALREIDEAAPATPQSPRSPVPQPDDPNRWSWSSQDSSPSAGPVPGTYMDGAQYFAELAQPGSYSDNAHYSDELPHSGAVSNTTYYRPLLPTVDIDPQQHQFTTRALPNDQWAPRYDSAEILPSYLPPEVRPVLPRIPNDRFFPYVQLFFNHLFPIMPIIDRAVYLNPALYNTSATLGLETYAFLCALSAATIVQLDAAAELPAYRTNSGRPLSEAELFVEECLRARRDFDYIGHPTTMTIMTSFFIFAFYGNIENSEKAWHYLQEGISFIECLDMDDERAFLKLDPIEAQWRRRLYWLLFVTERAYSIQRRKPSRLHASVQLPLILESEDPALLNGFVNLVHLFAAVDDNFVSVWRGTRRGSICSAPWLAETQRSLDGVAIALDNITETQQLDISVSREWLHVLAWQVGISHRLIAGKGYRSMELEYPVELARRVVSITEGANTLALDSHGIGMEQKLSDIAGCLADVLRVNAGDMSVTFLQGRQYLHLLVNKLSLMRGKESRYLRPLMIKVGDSLNGGIPQIIAHPTPMAPTHIQTSVRPMGHVYDEQTTAAMQAWEHDQLQ
ncbi:hypothetical protein MBLNU459_g0923t1 [Dothideomycetes sp. NU459]